MPAVKGTSIPVWTSNRGTMMMIRVALTQSGKLPVFVSSFDELQSSARAVNPQHVIVGLEDLAGCGISASATVASLRKDIQIIFLAMGSVGTDVASLKAHVLKVPFSAAELRAALDSTAPASSSPAKADQIHHSSPSDLTEMVRAEIERIIMEKAEAMVAEAVMKIVPELAETMIQSELQRLLTEEGEKAVTTEPAKEDEQD